MPELIPQVPGSSGTHVVALSRDELTTVINALRRRMQARGTDGPTQAERRLYLQLQAVAENVGVRRNVYGFWEAGERREVRR